MSRGRGRHEPPGPSSLPDPPVQVGDCRAAGRLSQTRCHMLRLASAAFSVCLCLLLTSVLAAPLARPRRMASPLRTSMALEPRASAVLEAPGSQTSIDIKVSAIGLGLQFMRTSEVAAPSSGAAKPPLVRAATSAATSLQATQQAKQDADAAQSQRVCHVLAAKLDLDVAYSLLVGSWGHCCHWTPALKNRAAHRAQLTCTIAMQLTCTPAILGCACRGQSRLGRSTCKEPTWRCGEWRTSGRPSSSASCRFFSLPPRQHAALWSTPHPSAARALNLPAG